MLSKKDAIAVGKAVCDAARRVTETSEPHESNLVHMGRGTCIYAMDNLWYDVFPPKVRDYFGRNKDAFYEACGWPE